MKKLLFCLLATLCLPIHAGDSYLSVKLEIEQTLKTSANYLTSQQNPEGWWEDSDIPAFTALAVRGIMADPTRDASKPIPENIRKALDWIAAQQKEDGGIYVKGLATYNTATSLMALLTIDSETYKPNILKARAFLIGQQADDGIKGETDGEFDGGIGYGGSYDHSDLSNTHLALEAIYHSRILASDSGEGEQPELDYEAALTFISRTQNLQATNDRTEKVGNDGGFVYFPGDSKAGEETGPDGKVALRSYGSMSYAGLLSFIYADLDKTDPRVTAVTNWLHQNYSIDENPGMKQQGLFYYYQTMAKTLAAANLPYLETAEGKKIDWRRDLAVRLINTQREDGSWLNESSRWMENRPILVTSYVALALQQVHATMPQE